MGESVKNVYIVKSGQLTDFVGWEWLNLKAFADYSTAVKFYESVRGQIRPEDFGVREDLEIETLTLEV